MKASWGEIKVDAGRWLVLVFFLVPTYIVGCDLLGINDMVSQRFSVVCLFTSGVYR